MIAAMQGFFVHVSAGSFPVSGLLAVNNTARNANPSTIFFSYTVPQAPSPLIRLTAGFADEGTDADPAVFYFRPNANGAFDKKLDALKLMNTHIGVPNLFAVSSDTAKLSIYALPDTFDSVTTVPLGLKTAKDGWISFKGADIENMPYGLHVYLSDAKTGVNQDLQNAPPYRLFLAAADYENRFYLNFSTKELPMGNGPGNTPGMPVFKAYSAGGYLFVNPGLTGGDKGELRVVNLLGQVILREEIGGDAFQQVQSNFAQGIYFVNFYTPAGTQTEKVLISSR
jgi:fibronectin-binding autotransporter adhesin